MDERGRERDGNASCFPNILAHQFSCNRPLAYHPVPSHRVPLLRKVAARGLFTSRAAFQIRPSLTHRGHRRRRINRRPRREESGKWSDSSHQDLDSAHFLLDTASGRLGSCLGADPWSWIQWPWHWPRLSLFRRVYTVCVAEYQMPSACWVAILPAPDGQCHLLDAAFNKRRLPSTFGGLDYVGLGSSWSGIS